MNKWILSIAIMLLCTEVLAKGTLVIEPSKWESSDTHSLMGGFEVEQPIMSFLTFKNETGLNFYKMPDTAYSGYKLTTMGFKNGIEFKLMKLSIMPYFNLMYLKELEHAEKEYGMKLSYELWD